MGGVVAYEMAQQLSTQGQKVGFLALFDAEALPGPSTPEEKEAEILSWFAESLRLFADDLDIQQLLGATDIERWAVLLEQAKQSDILAPTLEANGVQFLFNVFNRNVRAMWDYLPLPYAGQITLFKAEESPAGKDPTLGWERLVSRSIACHTVPGNHFTMMRGPHVETLAARLSECLSAHGHS